MHLFRWMRFLSRKSRSSASPRRSSRGFFRSFHSSGHLYRRRHSGAIGSGSGSGSGLLSSLSSSHSSSATRPSEQRPSVIYIDQGLVSPSRWILSDPTDQCRRSSSSVRRRRESNDEGDRQFLEDFHNTHGQPESQLSPSSAAAHVAFTRVSSMFQPSRRSTIMQRATAFNLFNDLQFQLDTQTDANPSDQLPEIPLIRHNKSKKELKKTKSRRTNIQPSEPPEPMEGTTGGSDPSLFRQYWASIRATSLAKKRLSGPLCHEYMELYRGSLNSVNGSASYPGSGRLNRPMEVDQEESPPPAPMQFLFFGGSTEEDPHHLREVDKVQRRCRARFVAQQPDPSVATTIHIRPTLVRNLPPVFMPSFT